MDGKRCSFKIHPACLASPAMTPEQYAELKADITERGLLFPIVMHKGMVLDGRHRLRVCNELGIEPETLVDDELREHGGDPWAYVWSTMQHKQPTTSQLSAFSVEWQLSKEKPDAKKRQKQGRETLPDPQSAGKSSDKTGQRFGISGRTVSKAVKVKQSGCQQLFDAVRDGRINVTVAERAVKACNGDADKLREVVAVAMVQPEPEKELKKAIATPVERQFNSETASDKLIETLRRILDTWPEQYVPKAINVIYSVISEYKK